MNDDRTIDVASGRAASGHVVTVDTDDLVTVKVIAERFEIKASAVTNWVRRYEDFPAPLIVVDHVKLWSWQQVKAWSES